MSNLAVLVIPHPVGPNKGLMEVLRVVALPLFRPIFTVLVMLINVRKVPGLMAFNLG